jgi:hypothetical protein
MKMFSAKSPLVFFWLVLTGLLVPGTSNAQQCLSGSMVFPADNVWNAPVDRLPVHPNSAVYITTIGPNRTLHPDFGSGDWPPDSDSPIGIPYITVPGTQPKVPVSFDYRGESDPGPYPVPKNAPIEGGPQSAGDRHVLVIDSGNCMLYELFDAFPLAGGAWHAGSGAVFNLKSDALRPAGWTSADAAGLSIFAGLVRYDEVASGQIRHALRFTAPQTKKSFVWPARHYASNLTASKYPPMGQRFRLKAGFNISGFSPQTQVILRALKRYGMMLSDNGSAWYISGAPDKRWNNDVLHELSRVRGSDFEAVDVSSLMLNANSGAAAPQVIVGVKALQPSASEQGPVEGVIQFFRVGDKTDPLRVFYAVGGSASNGTDYVRLPGSVVIPTGLAALDVFITPIDDKIKEGKETVTVTISRNSLYTVGSCASATVIIADND